MPNQTVLKLINLIKTMDAAAGEMMINGKYDDKYDVTFEIAGVKVDFPFSADAYCYLSDAFSKLLFDEAMLDMDAMRQLGHHQWVKHLEDGDQPYFITFEFRGQTIYNPWVMDGRPVDPVEYFGKAFLLSNWMIEGKDFVERIRRVANEFVTVTLLNNCTGYEHFKLGNELYFNVAFRNFCIMAANDVIEYHECWELPSQVFEELIEKEYTDKLFDLLVQLTISTKQFEDFAKIWDNGFLGFVNGEISLSVPRKARFMLSFVGKGKDLPRVIKEAIMANEEKTGKA
ncbi:hypothetical protein D3C75_158840 [compost metagenome]